MWGNVVLIIEGFKRRMFVIVQASALQYIGL